MSLTFVLPLLVGLLFLLTRRAPLWLSPLSAFPGLLTALTVSVGTRDQVNWLLLGCELGLDRAGQAFCFFTALLWLISALFALGYLRHDDGARSFFAFFQLAMAGNLGLAVALDPLGYYTAFALMSFASYGLVIHSRSREALFAGRIYLALVVLGEVSLFAGLALIAPASAFPAGRELAAVLLFTGFGLKAGVVLLHVWLPLAHPAAPIPASAVLSGAMIKAGVLGWIRFLPTDQGGEMVLALGLVTAFYGAIIGVCQTNPKTVLAYSSISQIGLITVGVGAWLLSGRQELALTAVMLYALHHALAKGALFLGVGLAGRGRTSLALLALPALSLAGLPLTSGAVAKAALKSSVGTLGGGWPALLSLLLPLAALGTTLLMARFLWLMSLRPAGSGPIRAAMWGSFLILLVGVAGATLAWPGAGPAFSDSLKPASLWVASWPVVAGCGLSLALARLAPTARLPAIPAGDVLAVYLALARGLRRAIGSTRGALRATDVWVRRRLPSRRVFPGLTARLLRWELRLRGDMLLAGCSLVALVLILLSLGQS